MEMNSIIRYRSTVACHYQAPDFYCYLIHFERPIGNLAEPKGQASHYLGATSALEARLFLHAHGNGAALMAAVGKAGVSWSLVRLWRVFSWEESRDLEHALKRRHNNPQLCPVCNPRLGPDPLVGLRLGHWPLRIHAYVGRRRPMNERNCINGIY